MPSKAYDDIFSLPPQIDAADMKPDARHPDPAKIPEAARVARRYVEDRTAQIVGVLGIPGTVHDIARRTGIPREEVEERMRSILDAATIRETGETRPGPDGVPCTVYDQITAA